MIIVCENVILNCSSQTLGIDEGKFRYTSIISPIDNLRIDKYTMLLSCMEFASKIH